MKNQPKKEIYDPETIPNDQLGLFQPNHINKFQCNKNSIPKVFIRFRFLSNLLETINTKFAGSFLHQLKKAIR